MKNITFLNDITFIAVWIIVFGRGQKDDWMKVIDNMEEACRRSWFSPSRNAVHSADFT